MLRAMLRRLTATAGLRPDSDIAAERRLTGPIDDMSVGDDNNILSAAVCKKAGSETLLKSGVIDDPTRCGPNLRNRFTRLQSQGWVCHNFAERHIAKVEIEDLCATATSRSERTRQWNGYHYEARRPDRRFRGLMVTS